MDPPSPSLTPSQPDRWYTPLECINLATDWKSTATSGTGKRIKLDIEDKLRLVYDLSDKKQKRREKAVRKRFWQIYTGLTKQSLTCEMRRVVCGPLFSAERIFKQHKKAVKVHRHQFYAAGDKFKRMPNKGWPAWAEGVLSANPDLIIMTDAAGPPPVVVVVQPATAMVATRIRTSCRSIGFIARMLFCCRAVPSDGKWIPSIVRCDGYGLSLRPPTGRRRRRYRRRGWCARWS